MNEKRFENSKSDITDYRIYDYEKEDAYFIDCDDKGTVDAIVNLLNELNDENRQLKQILRDIVGVTEETYTKNKNIYKVTFVFDGKMYNQIRRCCR